MKKTARKLSCLTIFIAIFLLLFFKYKERIVNYYNRWVNVSFCDRKITYRVGSIDSNFDISESDFIKNIEEATKIWEEGYGKELFIYDPESSLEINLVYDERQKTLSTIEELENKVDTQKETVENSNIIYDEKLNSLKSEIESLNKLIDYWNSRGGAPEKEYKEITEKQQELSKKTEEINQLGSQLSDTVDKVNYEISSLNEKVSKFNSLLSLKPEVGIYTSGDNKIDIFFYSDEDYLVKVIAHELGHAIGLDHVDTEGAIMNPVVSDDTQFSEEDRDLVKNFCSSRNRLDLIKSDFNNFVYTVKSKISLYLRSAR